MMRVRDSNYGKNSNSRMLNQFVQHYFYLLHGKIYSKPDGTLMLALEKEHPENEGKHSRKYVRIKFDCNLH